MVFLVPIAIVLLLVLANAVFVAAEFAIVGAPRASIDHQAAQGSRLAARVAQILDEPRLQDRYIATTQIGISIASLGLGMYGEHGLSAWIAHLLEPYDASPWIAAHTMAGIAAIAALTYLHIVLGEMVPKALALQSASHTVLYVSPVIRALEVPIRPVVAALNASGNALLRLIGIRRREVDAERYHTSDELQFIIKESQEGGLLRGEAGRMLRELFEFGDLTAGEVMVPRVRLVGIPAGIEVDELQQIVRTNPHTRYPVYVGDFDNIIGSVHIKQLLRHFIANRPVTANDARPLPYLPETTALDEVLAAMRRQRSQMAVVMDEQGGTAGIVTIEDLFEEVVGEIDEGRGRLPIVKIASGRVLVRGTVRLKDAGEALGVTLQHEDVHSVSGLVLALLGRPAVVGDVVTCGRARIEVTAVAGRGVAEATLTVSPPPATLRDQIPH
ncbi:MAG TPA: hemolysin family protein [Vicinamibacterales bacterium]|nr:hemolysin family protein [Vicinamibacterales bacterium]